MTSSENNNLSYVSARKLLQDILSESDNFTVSLTEATSPVPAPGPEGRGDHFRFTMETFVTLLTTILCVVGNSLILIVAARTNAFENFNRCYIFSITAADLFVGMFVTPFCIFNTMYGSWVFNSSIFCCVEAYIFALFILVSMTSIAFIIVDHYVAVRKPDRYGAMMSFNRSLCWIVLTWVIATSFCCPPLFSLQTAYYYSEAFVCLIDEQHNQTYFLTVTFMVTLPTIIAVLITCRYLFTKDFKDQKQFYEKVYDHFAERSWNYYISFVITAMFFLSWVPTLLIRLGSGIAGWPRDRVPKEIHFYSFWFAISNCFSKFFVYAIMSPQFRQGLLEVCEISTGSHGYSRGGGGEGGERDGERSYYLCKGSSCRSSSSGSESSLNKSSGSGSGGGGKRGHRDVMPQYV